MPARRRAIWLAGAAVIAAALLVSPAVPVVRAIRRASPTTTSQRVSSTTPIAADRTSPRPVGRVVRTQVLAPGIVLQVIRVANPPQQITVVRAAPWARVRASLVAAGPAWAPFAIVSNAVHRNHALVGINGYFRGPPSESPMLIRDGRIVAARRGALPTERHPRTAVGVDGNGGLLLVTVDGRRADAIGMTYPELAVLMRSLGARWAINLDGGASTTMVAAGRVVNRPSDPEGERVVPTVVVLVVSNEAGRVPLLHQLMALDPRIVFNAVGRSQASGRAI